MNKVGWLLFGCLTIGASVYSQSGYLVEPAGDVTIPFVSMNDRSVSLQAGLFPDLYKTSSPARDLRWVQANDSGLAAFLEESGNLILETLARYSGIPWLEADFDIFLVRYYPTMGASQPLILPVGGIRRGVLMEAAPTGAKLKLNLIYQLAHRNLAQTDWLADSLHASIASHALMQPGPYRRDNLAMLLALVTAQQVMGLDSTYEAFQSAFWQQRTVGRQILQDYLLGEWILTPERPLAVWIAEEPTMSKLVTATRPPRITRPAGQHRPQVYIEDLPLKGQLGFSVKAGESNYLVVDQIDVFRLAYACGLRAGDVIRRVNGARPRTHKDLIEKVMAALEEGGATLQVSRENQIESLVIQPVELPSLDEPDYWQYFEDSLWYNEPSGDSTSGVDSAAPEE
ncbi:MAG TPA: PDZ domain-containing protein [Acidobacteriota bacterium]|nr:PDZ domain-containing protein [Acidobacteriota bacterium]